MWKHIIQTWKKKIWNTFLVWSSLLYYCYFLNTEATSYLKLLITLSAFDKHKFLSKKCWNALGKVRLWKISPVTILGMNTVYLEKEYIPYQLDSIAQSQPGHLCHIISSYIMIVLRQCEKDLFEGGRKTKVPISSFLFL